MDPINPDFKKRETSKQLSPDELFANLISGDRGALSQTLTLVESKLPTHRTIAEELIEKALPLSGNSIRIGITGVPGVGKSTFIEAFGGYLTSVGKKVAVLAIDPSSTKSRGSILGDKTRMTHLSQNEKAFIRPSPTTGSLGGVAGRTRESVLLCEAAGFDVIIIETVGVGQSETTVKSMVDFFILLMLAGAGDELQGIKRGIMEMADLLLINKADGENKAATKRAVGEYKRALHLFPPNENEWTPKVAMCSAVQQEGITDVWQTVQEFENQQKTSGYFEATRKEQALNWFREHLHHSLLNRIYEAPAMKGQIDQLEQLVRTQQLTPQAAVGKLLNTFFRNK